MSNSTATIPNSGKSRFAADGSPGSWFELDALPKTVPPEIVGRLPPVVVQTSPVSGNTRVDSSVSEIRVTFSKEMADGSWSWIAVSPDTFPKTTGEPRYLADGRTCVLPVKLEAGRTYATWLNSNKFKNFKDAQGRPAVPYLLIFETR